MKNNELLPCLICKRLPFYICQISSAEDYLIEKAENGEVEILNEFPPHYSYTSIREAVIGCKKCKKTISCINDDLSFNKMYESLKEHWNNQCKKEDSIFWKSNDKY